MNPSPLKQRESGLISTSAVKDNMLWSFCLAVYEMIATCSLSVRVVLDSGSWHRQLLQLFYKKTQYVERSVIFTLCVPQYSYPCPSPLKIHQGSCLFSSRCVAKSGSQPPQNLPILPDMSAPSSHSDTFPRSYITPDLRTPYFSCWYPSVPNLNSHSLLPSLPSFLFKIGFDHYRSSNNTMHIKGLERSNGARFALRAREGAGQSSLTRRRNRGIEHLVELWRRKEGGDRHIFNSWSPFFTRGGV